MNKKEFGRRLQRLRQGQGLTQHQLAPMLGISRSTLGSWESGERTPDPSTISELCRMMNTTSDYLLQRTDNPHPLPDGAETDIVSIPVVGEIRAGEPILARERIMGYTYFPRSAVPNDEASYFALRVQGDSMVDAGIKPGSTVLIRQQANIGSGEIGLVLVGDEDATIKRVYIDGDRVFLQPASPNHQPIIAHRKEVRVLGKAMQVSTAL